LWPDGSFGTTLRAELATPRLTRARTTLRRWPGLAVATAVVAVGAGAVGVPSSALFAAILTGLVWALTGAGGMAPPRRAVVAAQAVI
jgi:hypothetical protein